ncbi:MAG TPA: zf-HC2 domain-containing protein [Thermoanaerobaculia bacterium]|nr:zf-HC2 domain-containing protein [Thermoanaerobaculia bacterium]
MDERNDPLASAVKKWAEEARTQSGEHPEAARLVAFAEDTLDPAAAERLRDHLALCRECSRRVLELRGALADGEVLDFLAQAPADVPALSAAEVEREWQRLWGSVRAAERRPVARRRADRAAPWVPWALAAGLLVTTLGASGWVVELQRRLGEREPARPRTDAVFVEWTATGGTLRGEPVVTSAAAPLFFAVQAGPRRDEGGFRWEILGAGGRRVWISPPQPRPARDRFVLQLPSHFLAPGGYRLRLTASGPQGSRELAVQELRIRP